MPKPEKQHPDWDEFVKAHRSKFGVNPPEDAPDEWETEWEFFLAGVALGRGVIDPMVKGLRIVNLDPRAFPPPVVKEDEDAKSE